MNANTKIAHIDAPRLVYSYQLCVPRSRLMRVCVVWFVILKFIPITSINIPKREKWISVVYCISECLFFFFGILSCILNLNSVSRLFVLLMCFIIWFFWLTFSSDWCAHTHTHLVIANVRFVSIIENFAKKNKAHTKTNRLVGWNAWRLVIAKLSTAVFSLWNKKETLELPSIGQGKLLLTHAKPGWTWFICSSENISTFNAKWVYESQIRCWHQIRFHVEFIVEQISPYVRKFGVLIIYRFC